MNRAEVVYRFRRAGGGTVWVHRRRGGWRSIRFDSAPTALGKLLGLASVLDRIGSATTTVVAGVLRVAQAVPAVKPGTPLVPRAGPCQPICPQAP
jgi:hypothetical protein